MAMYDWMHRMSVAVRTGWNAGWTAFQEWNYAPLSQSAYDDYRVRLARYWLYELYATNTVFTEIETFRQQHKNQRNLYRHIRSIYNPVSRLISLEKSKVYGGSIDYTNELSGGAIPVVGAEPALIEALIQLYQWSNMGANKNEFVRQGATTGDSALKVIDDLESGKVRLEVLDPRKIAAVSLDAVGNVKAIVIEYMRYDPDTKRDYKYTEMIDGEAFRTFRDDQPFSYYMDADGRAVPAWDNEYGFVPVRLCKHQDAGDLKFGTTSFGTSLAIIDEMNDLASTIHDAIRKNVNPPWGITGNWQLPENKKITSVSDEKDQQPFIKLPEGAVVHSMVHPLDIPGAMGALADQVREVEKNMPQLTLQNIRDRGGNLSGVAIENLYGDASDAILLIQGNYDASLIAASQMAVSIGGYRRYRNFEPFDLNSFAAGDLDYTMKPRPVFTQNIDKQAKLNMVLQAAESPAMRVVMTELGYSDEQIDEIEANVNNREAAAVRGLATAAFGNEPDDEENVVDGEEIAQTPALTDGRQAAAIGNGN